MATEEDLQTFASTPVAQASDALIVKWTEYLRSPDPRQVNPRRWHGEPHESDGDLPSVATVRAALEAEGCEHLPVAVADAGTGLIAKRGDNLHNLYHIVWGIPFNKSH